ncbi:sensor protein [Halorubrum californiense DSM 19288]|uniref:Sensor protein n=1 Tax=Halorubrum californiense DSM 19288 TaxID=1227465 RepID=M0EJ06_9EURY|nr:MULTISPECIES: DICT sensory domain-containing protein [Halorubrum]ELZ47766.1 sensor protein [Halorubrum californiense DSM 19288]TKX71187.1 histidine kinase [Halorubrum sp. GN11GM_10-3_MGM]
MAESLRSFFDELEAPDRHLVLLNRSSPDPVRNLFDSLLDGQPVSISEADTDEVADDDVIALVEDGEVIARSPLDEPLESVLLINSDLYKTGGIDLDEVALPAVFEGLDEVPFRIRGYPASNKENLLLIIISRVIERIAAEHARGTLRASFQRLSRIDDERGTRSVYERVAGTGVDVHVYGVGDVESLSGLPVTVHSGTSYPYRRSWFVVFTPPEGGDGDHVALLALEDEPNVWDGFWTFRPKLVTRIEQYIAEEV